MTPELEALERLKPCPFCGCADVLYSPPCNDVEPDDFVLSGWQACCRGVGCGVMGPTCETADEVAKHWNTRADSKPLPWLRAEDVTESGSYWWVNDASYATPVTVYVMKSGTDESCFASAGQLGWWKAMQLPALGGLWQRIPEPELPKEGE